MQSVALIDYGSGNLHSAEKALARVAAKAGNSVRVTVTSSPDIILEADRLVLPGVGAFGACMNALKSRDGIVEALTEAVQGRGVPFLGICVGMQLLATRGLEYGEHQGLDWIPGTVRPLEALGLKIPHMGWNDVHSSGHALFPDDADAYFVHSYCFDADERADIAAQCTYGEQFTAAVIRGNIAGVQFHPEKSQTYGLAFLKNFLEWSPS